MLTGPELDELKDQHWLDMDRTRKNAQNSCDVIAGVDQFVLPETFTIAGADQYIGSIPHPRTMPGRVLQKVISKRPGLSIPLGPKGLGITAQRLTTKVEQPLNAICEDKRAGFQWPRACALLTYEGFAASVTVLDPSDWKRHPSQWEDEQSRTWKKRYRVDSAGRDEDHENYSGEVDDARARRMSELDLDVFRARNVPIRHRAIGIRQCAPIFDGDTETVGGLIISQEFSTSYLKRRYEFGDAGLMTPTGGNGEDSSGTTRSPKGGTLTLVEAWLYDEDGIPYVAYCVKGKHAVETRWKDDSYGYGGQLAVINLKERFGLDRLPVTWRFGLGNPGEINADLRAMGLIEPFAQSWKSVRAKLTAMNVACMWMGFPALIEESDTPMAQGIDNQEPDNAPDILPMKITEARPGTRLRALEVQPFSPAVLEMIQLELGTAVDESPGKSNKDQSGFSQSLAEAFEELAMTTVHTGLGELYEEHGSFVLEAGKRLPEHGKTKSGGAVKYAPIMVFNATDVPTNDSDAREHREPMELDPDLIDETFTCVAQYTKSMSIPEEQQSMEAVARNLKTRRRHLEDTGDPAPETTELELMLEAIRGTEAYQKYAMSLMAKVQGSEELEAITNAQQEGLAEPDTGMPTGAAQGVMPAPPPGMPMPLQPGAPGVPVDGSVTGMAAPQYGQNQLAGIVAGPGMVAPMNAAQAAGGVLPPNLPTAGVV